MGGTKFKWVILLILLLSVVGVYPAEAQQHDMEDPIPNELLVKYSTDYRSMLLVGEVTEIVDVDIIAPQVQLLTFAEDADMEMVTAALENDPSVEFVEANYERAIQSTVNDPHYRQQWWIPHIHAQSFWEYAPHQQRKIVVAVIDSGIDVNHEDLIGRIEPGGYNFYSKNTDVTDYHGHGTNVAGVIAAQTDNGLGISGVTGLYDVSILPLKISHLDGRSRISDMVKAIDYAVQKEVDVINISLGGGRTSTLEKEAVQRAFNAGIVVIAAAGNDAQKGNPVIYPAAHDQVISVGSVNRFNSRSAFSTYNQFVDLVAPGESIYTTSPFSLYENVNGTSFSAPIVAGTVAMMKALNPEISNQTVYDVLTETALDLGAPGRDPHFGAGLLDIGPLVEESVRGNVLPRFKGDFPEMNVPNTKVFTVTFNQELDPLNDYSEDIMITDSGKATVSFTTIVDPENPLKLLIKPTTKWNFGEHYLTITTGVTNKNRKALKGDVRMKFIVEEDFGTIDIQEYGFTTLGGNGYSH